jgi:ubiquitin-like modifier-activating enzyme ATG7
MGEPAKFVSFASFIDTAFWSEVNKRKLNEWKLDESPKSLSACIGIGKWIISFLSYGLPALGDAVGTECRLSLGHESFGPAEGSDIEGELIVFNTIETFKKLNKADFLKEQGLKVTACKSQFEWNFRSGRPSRTGRGWRIRRFSTTSLLLPLQI